MKKIIILFLIALSSCKSFTDFTNQKATLVKNGVQKFELENNQIIIPLTINNKVGNFLFDTGAMKSIITDDAFLKTFSLNKENYYTSTKMKNATMGSIESNHFIADSIKSAILIGKKNIFSHLLIQNTKVNCSSIDSKNGILGFDIFKNAAQPINLDFENNSILVLSKDYATDGYIKLDSKMQIGTGNKIIIPFIIDNYKADFLFDTGNNGGFLLSRKDSKIEESKIQLECETMIGTASGFSVQKIKMYKDVNVKLQDIVDINTNITVFEKLTTNTLGINFIKNYNWILDFETGAIYMKKNTLKTEIPTNEIEKSQLKSYAIDNKLKVGFKNLSYSSSFNVGDEITAINNQKITPKNICEMQELLNKTDDWSAFNIEISK